MKYRLIKWYPGLPREWKSYKGEIEVTKRSECYVADIHMIPAHEIENNPEYWEKIKSYEIIAFKHPVTASILTKNRVGTFQVGGESALFTDSHASTEEDLLKKPNKVNTHNDEPYEIYKAKDKAGRTFKVGDKTTLGTIIEFYINGYSDYSLMAKIAVVKSEVWPGSSYTGVRNINKLKPALTKDVGACSDPQYTAIYGTQHDEVKSTTGNLEEVKQVLKKARYVKWSSLTKE